MTDPDGVPAYLDRIGAAAPDPPDAAALAALHRAHLLAIPFENLDIHLGTPTPLDPAALLDKIVRGRRGGFCYELNGLFARLLEALGYRVARLAARVWTGERYGPPFDHLALLVTPPGGEGWLADVGFGRHSVFPLRWAARGDQRDPAGTFRLADTPDGDVDVLRDDEPAYRLELRERALADFGPTCWWQRTAPESSFTRRTVCSRLTPDGRVTIAGRRLIVTRGDDRAEEELVGDAALLAAYERHCGVVIPADRWAARGPAPGH
ncbi:N-hydroxyarylamine O-acetyltransferase [Pilimelia anulata]|uniref:N-hydroxyarylamine O-acetyltransferase n=1 Tax=Pilimelia anulata TaxID=53371 RepID=A0A8J3BDU3_9ACTN|nr:arylamine N-acetyltransferase [Pilimelia anulata]GGK06658.1 N-hydroxyarylamine O-acetyltransferase [Pilimelia anulata]